MLLGLIWNDIMQALDQYIGYAMVSSFCILLGIEVVQYVLRVRGKLTSSKWNWRLSAGRYLLLTYGYMVIAITILCRPAGSRVGLNLALFSTFSDNVLGNVYPVENILLFIPLGVLLPLLWRRFRCIIDISVTGVTLSMIIEVIQYITKRGYLQTDDIVLNTLGTMLGYGIYYCLSKCIQQNNTVITR